MHNRQLFYRYPIITLAILLMMYWIIKINQGEIPHVDQWVQTFIDKTISKEIYFIARWITELGSGSFLVPFTIITALILWWTQKHWLSSIFFAGGTLSSHLLNKWIKHVVERERPSIFIGANAEGYSFPSGHAMTPMVCYGLLMYFLISKFPRAKIRIQLFFGTVIILIGMSRVMINVHYLTDVVAGFLIGFILLLGLIYGYKAVEQQLSMRKN
ncbi:phosphatase PAP2 family protein [Virgibacillus sp. W0181]|uniref:phosphatase PAP2 family protein n=1 Tax=Virgibacillus sp. W0181 TaxID=3391581 RepID=UPI003F44C5D9